MKPPPVSSLVRVTRKGRRRSTPDQINDGNSLAQPNASLAAAATESAGWDIWILIAALALTVFEGAFRKWVIVSEAGLWKYVAYFSKDVVFAALLVLPASSVVNRPLEVFRSWLFPGCVLLLVGAGISAVHALNPVGAALTLRATVVLPFLVFLAVPRLKGISLRWTAGLLCALTVMNFALAIVQKRMPSDHVLNRYAAETEFIVAVESGVRATGTFSYITGLAVLSSVGIWAGMTLLSLAGKQWQRFGGWAAIIAGVGCGLATVSRAPVVIAAVVVVLWVFFSPASISVLARSVVAGALMVGTLIYLEVVPIFSELGTALRQRQEEAGDSFKTRAFGQFGETLLALNVAPLGLGLGTEQVGGNYALTGERSFTNFETQWPRLVLETGFLGLLGFLVICAGSVLALEAAKRGAASDGERAMLLATQLLLLPMFYANVVYNHTASSFVWIILAAALATITAKQGDPPEPVRASRRRVWERIPKKTRHRHHDQIGNSKPA